MNVLRDLSRDGVAGCRQKYFAFRNTQFSKQKVHFSQEQAMNIKFGTYILINI